MKIIKTFHENSENLPSMNFHSIIKQRFFFVINDAIVAFKPKIPKDSFIELQPKEFPFFPKRVADEHSKNSSLISSGHATCQFKAKRIEIQKLPAKEQLRGYGLGSPDISKKVKKKKEKKQVEGACGKPFLCLVVSLCFHS